MDKNISSKSERLLYLIFVIIGFGVIFVLALFPMEDVDTWMHLKYGEYIVNNKTLPQDEFFSYTVQGTRDVDHEWLAQVILYLVYRISGFDGLVFFKAIIIIISFAILLKTAHFLEGRSFLAVIVLIVSALTGAFRFIERPGLFTILLLSILIYILFTYHRAKNPRRIYFLPLIFLFWINLHGGFIIGWGLVMLYLACQLLFYYGRKKILWFSPFTISSPKLRLLAIFAFLSFVIGLANPYGLEMITFPFQSIFTLKDFFAEINEWKSPFDPMHQPREYVTMFVISGALTATLFLLNFRKFQPLYFLTFLFFLGASFTGMRNIILYALGIYLPLFHNLRLFLSSFKPTHLLKRIVPFLRLSAIIALFLLFLQFVFRGNSLGLNYHYFGTGMRESVFAVKAMDFIEQANIPGEMLNQYSIGSYLIWRSFPERKVFIDGRSGLYGEDFFFRYQSFGDNLEEFKKATEEFNFNYILLIDSNFLKDNPDWKLVYFDNIFRVYVKNEQRNQSIIDQYGYNYIDPNKTLDEILASYTPDTAKEFEKEILRTLAQNYQTTVAQVILAEFYQENGAWEKSFEQLKIAQETEPYLAHTYLALGNYYSQKQEWDQAIKNYKKARSLDFQIAQPNHNLGNVYFNQGQYKKAIKEYQKALYINDDYVPSYLGLGVIYSDYLIDPAKAIVAFQKYLELEPNSELRTELEQRIKNLQSKL